MDRGGELLRLGHVGGRGLAPDQVGVGGVGETAGDRGVDAVADAEEAFRRALAGAELAVDLVDVARQQRGGESVGARHDQRRHVADVRGEPRRDERADVLGGGNEHLAAEVAALLLRRQLVLEVHRRRTGLDERLHDLVGVERCRRNPPRRRPRSARASGRSRAVALGVRDLVGPQERAVDALDERRRAVRGVEALVGIGVAREVRVGCDLPAGEVDRLEARLDHLHGLAARHRTERRHPLVARRAVGAAAPLRGAQACARS